MRENWRRILQAEAHGSLTRRVAIAIRVVGWMLRGNNQLKTEARGALPVKVRCVAAEQPPACATPRSRNGRAEQDCDRHRCRNGPKGALHNGACHSFFAASPLTLPGAEDRARAARS